MIQRKQLVINGIVQGVGFRPFIYNFAKSLDLAGYVTNTGSGVFIEVQGLQPSISQFIDQLREKAPPLSAITHIDIQEIEVLEETEFIIQPTDRSDQIITSISPDTAVCPDCLEELFDPDNRRYEYPFINCTNCGPRYTIIKNIPYDRPYTTMAEFEMCPACQAEYNNPDDRRFHAQPNACPTCGPSLKLYQPNGNALKAENPILTIIEKLKEGKVCAIKGLGGYHLAVDAKNTEAIQRLRFRKGREAKPLAIMVKNMDIANNYCHINTTEKRNLTAWQHPIMLLPKKADCPLPDDLAPDNDRLGIMLPYTPLHHLLFQHDLDTLVMTSANYSEEPIAIENDDAIKRLGEIADLFLTHNRDIYLRTDDSVAITLAGETRQIRRSRGYAPGPIVINSKGPTVLGLGGELKNTICLLVNSNAYVSQHIGDLKNIESYEYFKLTIDHLTCIFDARPELIIHDLHPQYLSTQWALEQDDIQTLGVQHHHAHLCSVMAENQLSDPVIGIIMDGTGYGTDDTIWGGEVLIGNAEKYSRFARFEPMPLPGGAVAIKEPWRTAVGYLTKTFGLNLPPLPFLSNHQFQTVAEIARKGINSPLTSSAGRLFDAVAALCGGRQKIHYEAQAAIEFMQSAIPQKQEPYTIAIEQIDSIYELSVKRLIKEISNDVLNNVPMSNISSRFHQTLIHYCGEIAQLAREATEIDQVILSGGVFQNHILFEDTIKLLKKSGFRVYTQSQVPANDGGISLGQVLIGREFLA